MNMHLQLYQARDSIVCLPDCISSNKIEASFDNPSGCRLIKPGEYMEMISSMQPNLWTALADEAPVWVSEKRNKASLDQTTGGAVFDPHLEALVLKNVTVELKK